MEHLYEINCVEFFCVYISICKDVQERNSAILKIFSAISKSDTIGRKEAIRKQRPFLTMFAPKAVLFHSIDLRYMSIQMCWRILRRKRKKYPTMDEFDISNDTLSAHIHIHTLSLFSLCAYISVSFALELYRFSAVLGRAISGKYTMALCFMKARRRHVLSNLCLQTITC